MTVKNCRTNVAGAACINRGSLLIAVVGLLLALTLPLHADTIVSPAAPLAVNQVRVHPDFSDAPLLGQKFNVYTGSDDLVGWELIREISSDFASGGMYGTLDSVALRDIVSGKVLFVYRVSNTGTEGDSLIRSGNIHGYDPGLWNVVDSGVMHFDGSTDFIQGDVLQLSRSDAGGQPQVGFAFQAYALSVEQGLVQIERLLEPGQTSSWFYYQTDAPGATVGYAGLIDSGSAADHVRALVPAPEPVTLLAVFAGVASLGGYIRRRLR